MTNQLHADICILAELFLSSGLYVSTRYQFRDFFKQTNIIDTRLFETLCSDVSLRIPANEELIEHICFVNSESIKQAVLLDVRYS